MDTLRQDVRNNLTAYLLLTYDIKPNPQIDITSVDKEQDTYYKVCGKVVVKDKYGEKYDGKFTALYQYNSHDQQYKKLSIEVDELTRTLWTDILK